MKNFSLLLFFLFSFSTHSIVDPPNYDFSLDSLKPFHPGADFNELKKKFGKAEKVEQFGGGTIYKYYVSQIRYKFPVFIQVYGTKVTDFYARLPSYFLHNIFHQSIISRFGKQDQYFKSDRTAVYIWQKTKGLKLYYGAGCTITCFPMYFSAQHAELPDGLGGFESLISRFNTQRDIKVPTKKD